MSTRNPNPQAPVPDFPERVTNAVEVKLANARRSNAAAWATRRQQELRFEEGLASDPEMAGGLQRGALDASSARNNFERQVASGERSRWGGRTGEPQASWTTHDSYLGSFADGTNVDRAERRHQSLSAANGGRGVPNEAEARA